MAAAPQSGSFHTAPSYVIVYATNHTTMSQFPLQRGELAVGGVPVPLGRRVSQTPFYA